MGLNCLSTIDRVARAHGRDHHFPLAMYDTDRSDLTQRMAVSLPRIDSWPQWERVAELALGDHGRALTGIDFCGIEEGHPPRVKADFFREVGTTLEQELDWVCKQTGGGEELRQHLIETAWKSRSEHLTGRVVS